ncbi:MAG: hypothetical protein LDL41_12680 [Coleofasciculus sp. S288]|nr:hypothetical protein [Coleofasciculus sp. S288]
MSVLPYLSLWTTPCPVDYSNNQDWFPFLRTQQTMRTLDFTPSDSVLPNQTAVSTPLGAFVVLPEQLLPRTSYPKYVEKIGAIVPKKDGG